VTSGSCRASTWRRASSRLDFDGREVVYGFAELDELVRRRSTRPRAPSARAVVIPLTMQHYAMLQQEFGLHRRDKGKRLVVLVEQLTRRRSPSRERGYGGGGRSCRSG
jgi:hypothetical protein